jgi:hypothetical protein
MIHFKRINEIDTRIQLVWVATIGLRSRLRQSRIKQHLDETNRQRKEMGLKPAQ